MIIVFLLQFYIANSKVGFAEWETGLCDNYTYSNSDMYDKTPVLVYNQGKSEEVLFTDVHEARCEGNYILLFIQPFQGNSSFLIFDKRTKTSEKFTDKITFNNRIKMLGIIPIYAKPIINYEEDVMLQLDSFDKLKNYILIVLAFILFKIIRRKLKDKNSQLYKFMKKYIIPIIILFLASSCKQQNIKNTSNKYDIPDPMVSVDTTDGKQYIAILKNKNSNEIIPLKKSEFDTLEVLLKACIEKYNLDKNNKIDLRYYKRQYITSINEKGEKIVWINCFCSMSESNYWETNVVMVDDGGDCFFNLKINLKEKKYFEFGVNGEA